MERQDKQKECPSLKPHRNGNLITRLGLEESQRTRRVRQNIAETTDPVSHRADAVETVREEGLSRPRNQGEGPYILPGREEGEGYWQIGE